MTVCFSVILATAGRSSLAFAAGSVNCQIGQYDELIIAGGGRIGEEVAASLKAHWLQMPAGRNWGHAERNEAMLYAVGTHLLFVDDDDALLPGAIETIRGAVAKEPLRPHLFRMILPDGRIIPEEKSVRECNVGTPSLIVPNIRAKLGRWGSRYAGDFDFIESTLRHYQDGPVWNDEVIYGCREHGVKAWR